MHALTDFRSPFSRHVSRMSLFLGRLAVVTAVTLAVSAVADHSVARAQGVEGVQRDDFLRAAISALHVKFINEGDVPYTGVSPAMLPYVRTAEHYGALASFGAVRGVLDLERSITRGEALSVVVALSGFKPGGTIIPAFSDVRSVALKQAVAVGIERRWMRPLRTGMFGVDTLLRSSEQRFLLKEAGEDVSAARAPDVETIQITIGGSSSALPKQDMLQQVWSLLNEQYLYRDKLNTDDAGYGAAKGLVDSLKDPYTVFMPPASSQDFQTQLQGEVTGIGAQVEQRNGVLTIVAPLKGSPAERVGLQPGDEILSVNGKSLSGLSYDDAVHQVRGPKGSEAKLRIRRGAAEMDVTVIRDVVRIVELETSVQNGIAIVTLHQFGQITDHEFVGQMQQLAGKQPRAVILDLRNNPGGLLDAAGIVAGAFLPAGTPYVSISTKTETEMESTSGTPAFAASVPMVVLVNKGSASAAEIVAGALQDAGRAKVIGEKTFGKGTVQQVLEFTDGSSLKMTIAEWKTPKGRKIDGIGIDPDVTVSATPGTDAPLMRAFELLR